MFLSTSALHSPDYGYHPLCMWMTGFEMRSDHSIISDSDFIYGNRRYRDPSIKPSMDNEIYRQWQTWIYLMEDEDWEVTKSEGVPADGISSINKTDLPKYIEDYASAVESNLEMAETILLPCTRSLKKELNTLRCVFEKACQGIHKHYTYSFDGDALFDIFYGLQEVSIYTVELLQIVKNVADFYKLFSFTTCTSKSCFNRFLNRVLGPIIRNVKDSIFKLNELMQANLLKYYAASVMYDVISIIIALLLFICQSCLGPATDMKQLMIFATVIHLIISGDVESNPGPEYDPRKLLKKEPKVSDFQRIFIHSRAARHWQIFGRALDVEVNDLIDCPHSAAVMVGIVFERWSDQHKDFTWERIIRACEGYNQFGKVRDTIDGFLSSREAHEEYGDEPDFKSRESRRSENDHSNKTVHGLVITINVPTSISIFIIIILCSIIIYMYQWIC